jgi:uracil-DNA glycosylase
VSQYVMSDATKRESVAALKKRIEGCLICAKTLPHDPRPVTSWRPSSRILIIGQAPGRVVHESGVPWQDASGRLLRTWLSVSEDQFYDDRLFALVPMGFCFPGKGKSGDMAPRPECAPAWHELIRDRLKNVQLTILIGRYAQDHYLGESKVGTLTENVQQFEQFLPDYLPLPHPSPRNRHWFVKNPWFEEKLIPELQLLVRRALDTRGSGQSAK